MGDNRLLTLKEISRELGVNYKTVHYYKDIFEEFVFIQFQGRRILYLPENINLFSKILELKDEGYSNEGIREIFFGMKSENLKIYLSGDLDDWMSGDLDVRRSRGLDVWRSGDLAGWRSDYLTGDLSGCLDGQSVSDDVCDHASEAKDREPDKSDNEKELSLQISQLKDELLRELQTNLSREVDSTVQEKIKNLADALEDSLLKLTAEINGSLVQVYKAVNQIQEGLNNLDSRLEQLEKNLGIEATEGGELTDLELEKMQVRRPEINLEDKETILKEAGESLDPDDYSYADLQFVKASINNGKPDRTTVIQWIRSEKEKDPDVSYGELANRLNDAGIPTLSGRQEWSRSVVRNLAKWEKK